MLFAELIEFGDRGRAIDASSSACIPVGVIVDWRLVLDVPH
jgi:hypothetical protein